MNKHSRTVLMAVTMTLGLVSAFSIGLSSYLLVEQAGGGSADIMGADINENRNISGFAISYTGTNMGRYHFYDDDNDKSKEGTISYTIDIEYSKLPTSLKKENLYMVGILGFYNNDALNSELFDADSTYFSLTCNWSASSTDSITTSTGSLTFQSVENVITLANYEFNPKETTKLVLSFTLTQKCLLDTNIRSLLSDSTSKFHLQLKVGVTDKNDTEGESNV